MALCHYDWVATGFAYQTDTNDYEVVKFSSFCALKLTLKLWFIHSAQTLGKRLESH